VGGRFQRRAFCRVTKWGRVAPLPANTGMAGICAKLPFEVVQGVARLERFSLVRILARTRLLFGGSRRPTPRVQKRGA
jgi:hypothetical protein